MAKDVDLNSRQWLDLVFEGRNKKFGAYELRESSSRRHILAVGIVVMAGLALVFLPKLIKQPAAPPVAPVTQQTDVKFTVIDNSIVPEKMPARAVEIQVPATPTQRTVAFNEPVIVVDKDVNPDDLMLTQDELTRSGAAIGRETVEGEPVGRHPDDPAVNAGTNPVETPGPILTPEVWPKPGGDLLKWLSNNIHYPADAVELGVEGRVVLRFVVQVDGTIGNVEVLQKLYPSCDREAVRVVSKMPKWIPGRQNDKAVPVYFTLPVYFKLQK
ncbi:cell envelope biogenesis protein TonB [Bacteroidia bacterium]|nr:cell envelope biogenesis protein TonB [Bacteroidia bacterium]